jgi:hypothetical protein
MMPDRLDDIFQTSHHLAAETVAALTPEDLDRLRTIATEPGPSRIPAMNALVAAGVPDIVGLLGEILNNSGEDPATRAASAMQLASTGRADAEDVLVGALPRASHVAVRARITSALARVGSPFCLPDLERARTDDEPAVSRLAAFAEHAVAYRNGLPGHDVPRPDPQDLLEIDGERAPEMVAGRAGAEEAGATLTSLRNDTFGLPLSRRTALRIECGPSRLVFTYSDDFLRRGVAGPLRVPTLPGLVAQRATDGSYASRLLLFAGPEDGESFHLALYRTDGHQVMYGLAYTDDVGAAFELRGVRLRSRSSLPALIRGRIQGFEFVLTAAASTRTVTGASAPTPA